MSPEAERITPPCSIRLSGELADQGILNSLRLLLSERRDRPRLCHHGSRRGASMFATRNLSGFPASMLTGTPGVDLKVVDATLRVRLQPHRLERYLGENPPVLKDAEGFVDTGDAVELRGDRYHFQGRRDGVINVGGLKVHPEEVEAVLNRHPPGADVTGQDEEEESDYRRARGCRCASQGPVSS